MTGAWRLDPLRRLILRPRPPAVKLVLTCLGVFIAGSGRWLLDRGSYGVPFLTFYPVVLLTALFFGGRYGILSVIASLVVVREYLSAGVSWNLANTPMRAVMFALLFVAVGIMIGTAHLMRLLLAENQAHIDQAEAFNAELQHRAKNTLQILRALASRGPAPGEDAAAFHAKLLARMEALGKADELLRYGVLDSAPLADLVVSTIAPFEVARFHCAGPECLVHKSAATPLAMALHELATNALKYGALSRPDGSVTIEWRVLPEDRVALEWRERGGPPVTPPQTRGMGSRLLQPHKGLTAVALDWDEAGLICRLEMVRGATGRASPLPARIAENTYTTR